MKKIIFLLTLITFIFLISDSCKKKCESSNLGNVSFSPTDLQIVPYTGTEKLTFSDSLGNSMNFSSTGRITNYNGIEHLECPNGGCNGIDDCTGNYFYTESNTVEFNGISSYINLILTMDGGSSFHQSINKIIEISVAYSNWYFDRSYYFNALNFYQPTDTAASKVTLKDSLIVGPKKYYSIYVFNEKGHYGSNNLQYIFYTINKGIVGFRTSNNHTWYLN